MMKHLATGSVARGIQTVVWITVGALVGRLAAHRSSGGSTASAYVGEKTGDHLCSSFRTIDVGDDGLKSLGVLAITWLVNQAPYCIRHCNAAGGLWWNAQRHSLPLHQMHVEVLLRLQWNASEWHTCRSRWT